MYDITLYIGTQCRHIIYYSAAIIYYQIFNICNYIMQHESLKFNVLTVL